MGIDLTGKALVQVQHRVGERNAHQMCHMIGQNLDGHFRLKL